MKKKTGRIGCSEFYARRISFRSAFCIHRSAFMPAFIILHLRARRASARRLYE
jgi:hypothetical protein